MNNKIYAINIALLPENSIYDRCLELNKLDTTNYNNTPYVFVPHATLVMKSLDLDDIDMLKAELQTLGFDGINLEFDRYYYTDDDLKQRSGIFIKESSELRDFRRKVCDITRRYINKNLTLDSFHIGDYHSEDITKPLRDEDYFAHDIQFHITLGETNIKDEFMALNLPKNITFDRFIIGQMGNSGSIRKILSEIK